MFDSMQMTSRSHLGRTVFVFGLPLSTVVVSSAGGDMWHLPSYPLSSLLGRPTGVFADRSIQHHRHSSSNGGNYRCRFGSNRTFEVASLVGLTWGPSDADSDQTYTNKTQTAIAGTTKTNDSS